MGITDPKSELVKTPFDDTNRRYASHMRFSFSSPNDPHLFSLRHILTKSLIRPFALFVREPIIQLLGVYMAFIYGIIYLILTTVPSIYEGTYHQPPGLAGLNYIALGIGLTGVSQVSARLIDPIYKYLKERNGGIGRPEYRLRASLFSSFPVLSLI